jgi:hypothetical protein
MGLWGCCALVVGDWGACWGWGYGCWHSVWAGCVVGAVCGQGGCVCGSWGLVCVLVGLYQIGYVVVVVIVPLSIHPIHAHNNPALPALFPEHNNSPVHKQQNPTHLTLQILLPRSQNKHNPAPTAPTIWIH